MGARPVRRVKFNIGLTYDTSVENIKNIVDDIQKLIDDHPMTNPALRIHKNFEDPSKLEITNENEKIDKYISCRNQIKDFCIEFITKNF